MTTPQARCHAFVEGIVQGVGYRYFVVDAAAEAGVAGWVRNRRDGRVEFVAEGPRPAVEALLSQARRGPRAGRVDRVDEAWETPTGEFRGFRLEATI
jgi:acylphosphatase